MSSVLNKILDRYAAESEVYRRSQDRRQRILDAQNEAALASILDPSLYIGVCTPRRVGKSFRNASKALFTGESIPGARVLIVSLTLKNARENYWTGAPAGIVAQNAKFDLGLTFNNSFFEWTHENGSIGRLAGVETRADLEKLRGAAAEADLAIVDEAQSIPPELLEILLRDVLEPGLMTRDGRLELTGTPGPIPLGRFFQATCARSRVIPEGGTEEDGVPTCIPYADRDNELYANLDREALWSFHTWTLRDNRKASPNDPERAWRRALAIKKRNSWDDNSPSWRREYLGEWVTDQIDLVYAYAAARLAQKGVTWSPEPSKGNPTGLPPELGPWHLVMGLDFGFEDANAAVLAAWSETSKELRHVADFKSPHLTVDQFADEIFRLIDTFGLPEVIIGDNGGLGKMVVESMNQRHGLGIIAAEKRFKNDHIELLNSDFWAGRIKVIPDTDLSDELTAHQWDLSKDSKERLARTGKLRESSRTQNHLCDAFLYLWRYCYHFWSSPRDAAPERGTEQWFAEQARDALERAQARKRADRLDPHGLSRIRAREAQMTKDNLPWRN